MRLLAPLYRAAGSAAGALALAVAPAVALDAPKAAPQIVAPPEFGVLQFTEDEAWVDLPVPLADAWKQTLEVVASLNDAVSADLPYLESNGRIVAGDLWIAVEAAGAPGQNWVRIRVAIPDDEPEYGKVRAEIILDAIADRLEPPAPPSTEFSYPLPPVAEGVVDTDYVTNNYYYYDSTPNYGAYYTSYVPVWTPYWSPWCYAPAWNWGWWGWGGPWCNSWGWNWGFSACFGPVCASWNWGPWNSWGCNPWWGGWGGTWGNTVILGNGTIIVGATAPGVLAIGPRTTSIGPLPPGDLVTSLHHARRRDAIADAAIADADDHLPRVTDRPSRRAVEPAPAVVVTRTERAPRSARDLVASAGERPSSSAPTRTQTSPSRSSKKDGPRVVKLGSAPYSARVNPAALEARTVSMPAPTSGGTLLGAPSASASGSSRDAGGSVVSHPYSNPYPTSSPSSSAPVVNHGASRTSSPAPAAPAPVVSQPRASAPSAQPSRTTSAPSFGSRPSSSPPASSGHSSGGSSGSVSGGGKKPR